MSFSFSLLEDADAMSVLCLHCAAWPASTPVAVMKENIACLLANKLSLHAEAPSSTGPAHTTGWKRENTTDADPPPSRPHIATRRLLSLNSRLSLGRRLSLSDPQSHSTRNPSRSMSRRRTSTSSSPPLARHPLASSTSHLTSESQARHDLISNPNSNPTLKAPSARIDASHVVMSLNTDESERDCADYLLDPSAGSIGDVVKHQSQVHELSDAVTIRQCAAVLSGEFGLRSNSHVHAGTGGTHSGQDQDWEDGVVLPGNAHFCAEVRTYIHALSSFPPPLDQSY